MPIEKVASLQEAVQPADEIQDPKKGLALRYRYLLIAFLAFPGSFSLPVGCATYAYNKLKGDASEKSNAPQSETESRKVGIDLSSTLGANADSAVGQ